MLIAFDSSHAAMEAELLAQEAGLPGRLVPLPPAISAGCGLVLLCSQEHSGPILALLGSRSVPTAGLYAQEGGAWRRRAGT